MVDRKAAFTVRKDLAGDTYRRFLTLMLESEDTFSLVWRAEEGQSATLRGLRVELRPLELRHERTDRWPGRRPGGSEAHVRTYRCAAAALPSLLRPGSLYGWRLPGYPEDLHFRSESEGLSFYLVSSWSDARVLGRRTARLLSSVIPLERALDPFESPG